MSMYRKLLLATLAGIALAAPSVGALTQARAAASAPEETFMPPADFATRAELHVWRGAFATDAIARRDGQECVELRDAIRWAGPVYRTTDPVPGGRRGRGYYILVTWRN